jgi:hypothetical protein
MYPLTPGRGLSKSHIPRDINIYFVHPLPHPTANHQRLVRRYLTPIVLTIVASCRLPKKEKHSHCFNFISAYVKLHCDHHPNSDKSYLPYGRTLTQFHESYVVDAKEYGLEAPYSYTYFTVLLHEEFPHVDTLNRSSEFHCETCHQLEDRIEVARTARDPLTVQKLRAEKEAHINFCSLQRAKYVKHKIKARMDPDKYLTMIIDGMDQSKMIVPNLTGRGDVEEMKADLPQLHLTTARMADGHTYCYFNWDNIAKDGSLIPNILCRVLESQKRARGGTLPEVLYLQLDNTCRENKNRYVFAFLSLLVQLKVFRKIKVNFLVVGHTHEDVDQWFSQLNRVLGARPSTGAAIMELSKSITTTGVEVELIEDAIATKEWLKSQISEQSLTDFSQLLQFRFCLVPKSGPSSVATPLCSVQSKPAAGSDSPYFPEGSGAILLKGVPHGQPKLVNLRPLMCASGDQLKAAQGNPEVWTSKLDKIETIVLDKLYNRGYLRPNPEEVKSWWVDFLAEQRNLIAEGITGDAQRAIASNRDARVATMYNVLRSTHVGPWAPPKLRDASVVSSEAEQVYGVYGWTQRCVLPGSVDAVVPESDNVTDLVKVDTFVVLAAEGAATHRHPSLGTIMQCKNFKLVDGTSVLSPTCFVYIGQVKEILNVSEDGDKATCLVHWWGPAPGTRVQWKPLFHHETPSGVVGADREAFAGLPYTHEQEVACDGVAATFLRWEEVREKARGLQPRASEYVKVLPKQIVHTVRRRAVAARM